MKHELYYHNLSGYECSPFCKACKNELDKENKKVMNKFTFIDPRVFKLGNKIREELNRKTFKYRDISMNEFKECFSQEQKEDLRIKPIELDHRSKVNIFIQEELTFWKEKLDYLMPNVESFDCAIIMTVIERIQELETLILDGE